MRGLVVNAIVEFAALTKPDLLPTNPILVETRQRLVYFMSSDRSAIEKH